MPGSIPLAVWAIGKAFFPFQANGSLLTGPDGSIVGSKLIAQPFTKDEYFQPRPWAASYDASASASSTYAALNYLLRNRVATVLAPIVKYKNGPKAGQLVATDLESWFQQDKFQGNPHIVAQWADMHNALAQAWVNADSTHGQYVHAWSKAHPDLDPQITLANAEFQLDRVAPKWADDTKRDVAAVRNEIDEILQHNASAPFGGLAGEKLVNVLDVNLELCKRYRVPK